MQSETVKTGNNRLSRMLPTLKSLGKGTFITLVKGRYDSWGIYCDKYRLWQVRGQKIKDFKAAEALAFELYELCHRWQVTMAA